MSRRRFHVDRKRRTRSLMLEALEARAVPAGAPIHAIIPANDPSGTGVVILSGGGVEAAALRADGTLELVGSKSPDYMRPWSWTVRKDGVLLDQRMFETPPDRTNGGMTLISPDGSKMLGFLVEPPVATNLAPPMKLRIWMSPDSLPTDYELPSITSAATVAIANTGQVLIYNGSSGAFVWSPTGEMTELPSLYRIEGATEVSALWASGSAISADGHVVVGGSGKDEVRTRATMWIDGMPQELESPADQNSSASAISANGRLVGGSIGAYPDMQSVVWRDGHLIKLVDTAGAPAKLNVTNVLDGIGGESDKWVALGTTGYLSSAIPWIAFSDGVVHPLKEWLSATYGITLDGIESGLQLAGDENALYIVTREVKSIPPELGCMYCQQPEPMGRNAAHVLVLPIDYVLPSTTSAYDLSGDQQITALDVLIVINAINSDPGLSLGERPQLRINRPGIDVNGDGELTAGDALAIINYINAHPQTGVANLMAGAQGEAASVSDGDWAILAADAYFGSLENRRRA